MSRWLLTAWIPLLGIAACSPNVPVNTYYDHTADFSLYKTYSWEPAEDGYVMTLTDTRVRDEVSRNLAGKGFQEQEEGEGDLIIFVQTTKDEVRFNDDSYGWWKTGKGVPEIEFKDGSLILEFVDPARKRHVWHGVAENATTALGQDPNKLKNSVNKLLEDFPPGYRKRY